MRTAHLSYPWVFTVHVRKCSQAVVEHVVTACAPVCLLWVFYAFPLNHLRARLFLGTPPPTFLLLAGGLHSPHAFRFLRALSDTFVRAPAATRWLQVERVLSDGWCSKHKLPEREHSRLVVSGESEPESALRPSAHAQRWCYLRHIPQRPLSSFFN